MNDEQKRQFLNDILARVGTNAIGQVVIEQNNTIYVDEKQPPHLPPYLVQERAMEIYSFLVDRKFIDANTNAEHFLFLFGVKGVAPKNLKPVNWHGTQQQLRTVLQLTFETPLERKSLRLADIERNVPFCFLIKGKKITSLAKQTVELSTEIDEITSFFRQK